MEIKQNTPEWLEAKKSVISASEIYSLVKEYCPKDLSKIATDFLDEPFYTPFSLFCKIKTGIVIPKKKDNLMEFGKVVESAVITSFNLDSHCAFPLISWPYEDFVSMPAIHPLAACSPDANISAIPSGESIRSESGEAITEFDGLGLLEVKTSLISQFFRNFDKNIKFQYQFQLQFQLLCTGRSWGAFAVLVSKTPDLDSAYEKGKLAALIELSDDFHSRIALRETGALNLLKIKEEIQKEIAKKIKKNYDIYYFFVKKDPQMQEMCLKALKKFQLALDTNTPPAATAEDRELLGLIFPNDQRVGDLIADEKLAQMITERELAKSTAIESEKEGENLTAEIIQKMGMHSRIVTEEKIAYFDKRGSFRVKKNSERKKL